MLTSNNQPPEELHSSVDPVILTFHIKIALSSTHKLWEASTIRAWFGFFLHGELGWLFGFSEKKF